MAQHTSAAKPPYFSRQALWITLCMAIFIGLFFSAPDVLAAGGPGPTHPPGYCTSDPEFQIPYSVIEPGQGLISTIIRDIRNVLDATVFEMAAAFYIDPTNRFQGLLRVAVTLYVAIYGIMFAFGMIQSTVTDFFNRMIKIGIIGMVIGGGLLDWQYFIATLLYFFNDGTDSIISEVTRITVGGVNMPYQPGAPFAILDEVIAKAVSAKMAVALLATFLTGPYGILFGLLLLMSVGSLLKAMLTAIWVYVMSLVLKTLLIGLSPIFISFILFNRTRHLFDGWLNQLVNASLQPIFLFIFFAFFATLISASLDTILHNPVCWTQWVDSIRGTSTTINYWRFAIEDPPGSGKWEPFSGLWTWNGNNVTGDSRPFPIDIVNVLMFLMLAELASRFNNVIIMIASDIAGASANLASMQGPMSEWFSPGSGKSNSPVDGVGKSDSAKTLAQGKSDLKDTFDRSGFSGLGKRPGTASE